MTDRADGSIAELGLTKKDLGIKSVDVEESPLTNSISKIEVGERTAEISDEEVKKLVADDHLGSFMDKIRICDKTENSDLVGVDPETINRLKDSLQDLLSSQQFRQQYAFRGKQSITPEALTLLLPNLDPETYDRLVLLLNRGVDPVLIRGILAQNFGERSLPLWFIDVVESNKDLRSTFLDIITDQDMLDDFYYSRTFNDARLPKHIGRLEAFFRRTIQLSSPESLKQDPTEALNQLRSFFNLSSASLPENCNSILQIISSSLIKSSVNTYFELNKYGESYPYWEEVKGISTEPIDYIRRQVESLEIGKYATTMFRYVDSLYKEYFPEIYVDPKINKIVITDPNDNVEDPNEYLEEVDGISGYDPLTKNLTIASAQRFLRGGVDAFNDHVHGKIFSGRRKTVDSAIIAHEITHAIYDQKVGIDTEYLENQPLFGSEYSVENAISEGTSVLIEFLFEDKMVEEAAKLGLDEQDIKDIEANKKNRLSLLKAEKSHYTEGTFYIIHKIFREAAGPPQHRDVCAGLRAVNHLIETLDDDKARQTPITDPLYRELLKVRDPAKWREFLNAARTEEDLMVA